MKKSIEKVFEFIKRIINKIKKIFNSKKKIAILISCLVVLLIIVLVFELNKNRRNKFALGAAYELLPYEVKEIYANIVDVSCYGDLHFDIDINSGKHEIEDINKNNLIDYLFSYLDKKDLLNNKLDNLVIEKAEKKLFVSNLNLVDEIKNYDYGDYTYNDKNGKLVREKRECSSDIKYVSHLFGYSYNENQLSMDVNITYLKDGLLYNFDDEELGKYDGNTLELSELTKRTSFYRLVYIKEKGIYKLSSVEWISRG